MVEDSCAAEGITHEDTGILIKETVHDLADQIMKGTQDHERLKSIGQNAADKIYLSWDDAVGKAVLRYHEVIKKMEMKKMNA